MLRKVITTKDGSSTIFWEEYNETYHSIHGAWQESAHVFIKEGVDWYAKKFKENKEIRVFEVGFGTGLNTLLTIQYALQHTERQFFYYTIEPYPLIASEYANLNYKEWLTEDLKPYFDHIHTCPWGVENAILPNFTLSKSKCSLQDLDLTLSEEAEYQFDVLYFDAFAPNKQAEMWESVNLQKSCSLLKSKGIFVTYCAKGSFKRDLKALGIEVQSPHGAAGKREMTRGIKA
ncbi:MAG: tRNA (5-methylaminomethyl-2-thiouridine)(34)-methyltransferase MnmD [Thermoflexibacter sp.]|jgi:tRNA U34 5-methylaminomethyl-2-thiouridine-forming methyltransferase MnmC|nr:tRNA (5-methylaminomethyl-2-thiouridine)(34)-methyltransferase MnmD [Thermoflexibacter sp.]